MSEKQLNHVSPAAKPDEMVDVAVTFVRDSDADLKARLESLPVPVYLTDADGWVTFFNQACVDFAGRTPVPGQDRWCVTWRLYTEGGALLPHQDCPMAAAIRDRKPVRDVVAVAERPDGSRVMFTPYATPVLDEQGQLIGAVNLLVDVTDLRQAELLRAQAVRCRRLAQSVTDARTVSTLNAMAEEYEEEARTLSA